MPKTEAKLFPHPPKSDDIVQGSAPICYFLATILAILAKKDGAEIIQNMMQDNDDGTVTVRFFSKSGEPCRVDGKPIFIQHVTVAKDIPADEKHSSGLLWVKILEKAYGEFIFGKGNYQQLLLWDDAAVKIFHPMQTILGYECEMINLLSKSAEPFDSFAISEIFTLGSIDSESGSISQKQKRDVGRIQSLIGLSEEQATVWVNLVLQHKLHLQWKALRDSKRNDSKGSFRMLRFEDFNKLLNDIPSTTAIEKDTIKQVSHWVKLQRDLPGKRGTGEYSKRQIKLYDKLKQDLQDGIVIKAATQIEIVSSHTLAKRPLFNFDSLKTNKGLAAEHAYAVIRCEEKNINGVILKGVVVQNPWREFGRAYNLKSQLRDSTSKILSADSQLAGEFWLELNDFTKRVAYLSMGGSYIEFIKDQRKNEPIIPQKPGYVLTEDALYQVNSAEVGRPLSLRQKIIEDHYYVQQIWSELHNPFARSCRLLTASEQESIYSTWESAIYFPDKALPAVKDEKTQAIEHGTPVTNDLDIDDHEMSSSVRTLTEPTTSSESIKPKEHKSQEDASSDEVESQPGSRLPKNTFGSS